MTRHLVPSKARCSYVVHIYRRGDSRDGELVGLVEPVGAGEASAFRNREELWERLSRGPRVGRRRRPLASE